MKALLFIENCGGYLNTYDLALAVLKKLYTFYMTSKQLLECP